MKYSNMLVMFNSETLLLHQKKRVESHKRDTTLSHTSFIHRGDIMGFLLFHLLVNCIFSIHQAYAILPETDFSFDFKELNPRSYQFANVMFL